MAYRDTKIKLDDYRERIAALRAEMRALQTEVEPEQVEDYKFSSVDGPVHLSALFGDHNELIMIHNMGAGCIYCTLWHLLDLFPEGPNGWGPKYKYNN